MAGEVVAVDRGQAVPNRVKSTVRDPIGTMRVQRHAVADGKKEALVGQGDAVGRGLTDHVMPVLLGTSHVSGVCNGMLEFGQGRRRRHGSSRK